MYPGKAERKKHIFSLLTFPPLHSFSQSSLHSHSTPHPYKLTLIPYNPLFLSSPSTPLNTSSSTSPPHESTFYHPFPSINPVLHPSQLSPCSVLSTSSLTSLFYSSLRIKPPFTSSLHAFPCFNLSSRSYTNSIASPPLTKHRITLGSLFPSSFIRDTRYTSFTTPHLAALSPGRLTAPRQTGFHDCAFYSSREKQRAQHCQLYTHSPPTPLERRQLPRRLISTALRT